ncbi:hypothetical protein D9615_002390 [Tricholomella constricta]|uniref:Uncharacterized protein n=1 Tax=Tricholomella constricta TaxID=117010 RepID=A0A8H5HM42_9AGAR|nr:hypothetical protein D9615_002390 [Tricholomella constricta]
MVAVNVGLPVFLDPVISYLADTLPPPLYSFLINALSHCLALLSALFTLATSLISSNPLEWDAQKLLPPLITLFAAYFALVSFYRSTTWMLRTSVFFVKWGTIFGAFIAGIGWIMGNANGNGNGVGSYGVMSGFGSILLDLINGKGQNAAGGTRSRPRSQQSRSRSSEKRKPKPWEPFERHREWQYQENQGDVDGADAQQVIRNIIGTAGKVVKESGWWSVVKGVVEGDSKADAEDSSSTGGSSRKAQSKTKAGGSRSR